MCDAFYLLFSFDVWVFSCTLVPPGSFFDQRAKGYVIPTKSAAEMREILLGQGLRQKEENNLVRMPDQPFGNVR